MLKVFAYALAFTLPTLIMQQAFPTFALGERASARREGVNVLRMALLRVGRIALLRALLHAWHFYVDFLCALLRACHFYVHFYMQVAWHFYVQVAWHF